MGAQVTINGKTYKGGNNVSVINGVVYIDGQQVEAEGNKITVEVKGKVQILTTDADVTVHGDVDHVDARGSVQCRTVKGNIACNGSINCGDVGGGVDAGGSVNCGRVGGKINAGGSVISKA